MLSEYSMSGMIPQLIRFHATTRPVPQAAAIKQMPVT